MKILGLSKDLKVAQYLKNIYALDSFDAGGIPAFKKDEEYFLGGFKGFYAVLVDEDKEAVWGIIKSFFANYPEVTCNFSVSDLGAEGSLVHYMLRVGKDVSIEKRFELYSKKTRNQVRKSYMNSLRVVTGPPPQGFYDFYVANMRRLKSIAKEKSHFERLEKFLGESIVCFAVFDGEKLIGCNYSVVSGNYMTLLLNLSNNNYWNLNINDRLYDELITWAIQNKIEFVDFGPSVRRDQSHNHFKEGFGAIQRIIVNKKQMNPLKRVRLFFSQKTRNLHLRLLKLVK